MTPDFLLKYQDKILHTGKYLNVIRECGRDIRYGEEENVKDIGSSLEVRQMDID
jgi:hypothetical protein